MELLREYIQNIVLIEQEATKSFNNLDDLNFDPQNFEDQLNRLIASIPNLQKAKDELGYDLSELSKNMNSFRHKNDYHHSGETVMQHIKETIEAVEEFIEDLTDDNKQIIRIAAAFHDIGKAVTAREDPNTKASTFYGHPDESFKIAQKLLEKYKDQLGDLYEKILELIKHHDIFLDILNSSKNRTSLSYLRGFAEKGILFGENLKNLLALVRADIKRSKSAEREIEEINNILKNLEKYKQQKQENDKEKERKLQLAMENLKKYRGLIVKTANDAVVDSGDLYPDIQAIKTKLGQAGKYDAIKEIIKILER